MKKKRILVFLLTGLTILLLHLACSHQSRHKVLTTLFDGVPPDSAAADSTGGKNGKADSLANADKTPAEKPDSPQYFYHAPYAEKSCGSCHDMQQAAALIESPPELCYYCHTDFSEEFEVLHMVVEAGECSGCHNPHLSEYPALLTRGGQQVCLACHDSESLFSGETHAEIGEMACWECHNPHGGADEYMFN